MKKLMKGKEYSPADSGLDLDLRCIENVLTDYDSQHLKTSEFG